MHLPSCRHCNTSSKDFKRHEARQRQFYVISENIVNVILGLLIRWKCSGCDITFTDYPEFAVPYKRYTVDRYIKHLGLPGIFAIQKTWSKAPFGRDVQLLGRYTGDHYQYSNKMTTNDTARLLYLIAEEQVVDRRSCRKMLNLMQRSPQRAKQWRVKRIAAGTPDSAKVWSKAGWTGLENHDAAIVELADGSRFILVVFTLHKEKETDIIQRITEKVVVALSSCSG